MSSQCKPPCLPPSACTGEDVHTNPCPSHCAMVDLDAHPGQDMHPCPEQTLEVASCLCQASATCLDACPQVGLTCPPPAVPMPRDACCPEHAAAWDSCAPLCVDVCVCSAAIPCDPPQSKGGDSFPCQPTASPVQPCATEIVGTCAESFPLQHTISPESPCTPETAGTCVDTFPVQYPASPMDTCTLETDGTCVKTFPLQHIIPTVELCPTDTAGTAVETFPLQQEILLMEPCIPKTVGTCMENVTLQHPISAVEPCTLEVLETCMEEPSCTQGVIISDPCPDQCSITHVDLCTSQSVICTEPGVSQTTAEPTGTCMPQGTADTSPTKGTSKGAGAHPSPRAPFRLNTRTAAIVERCLSRCQNWLRGKK